MNTKTIRIYKITSTALSSDWCYVGKTELVLEKKWKSDKNSFYRWIQKDKKETKIAWFELAVKIDDLELKTFNTELLEEVQVDTKKEMKLLKRKWIKILNACNLNTPKAEQPPDPKLIKIYKLITTLDPDLCYVGHTTQTLQQRWSSHKSDFKTWIKNERITGRYAWFEKGFELNDLELESFKIELLEESKFENDKDIEHLERKWINNLKCCNINQPGRTQKEWVQENRDKICIRYRDTRKKFNTNYYRENREEILKQKKEYQETNREKINKYRNIGHNCPCGGTYTNGTKARHFKTEKHKNHFNK